MGYKMEATEIVTAVIGGIFGFLGGVSLKVLENEWRVIVKNIRISGGIEWLTVLV